MGWDCLASFLFLGVRKVTKGSSVLIPSRVVFRARVRLVVRRDLPELAQGRL